MIRIHTDNGQRLQVESRPRADMRIIRTNMCNRSHVGFYSLLKKTNLKRLHSLEESNHKRNESDSIRIRAERQLRRVDDPKSVQRSVHIRIAARFALFHDLEPIRRRGADGYNCYRALTADGTGRVAGFV